MNDYICEYCRKPHDGTYGSGRFCCNTCARKFSNTYVTEDGRQRQIAALNDKDNRAKSLEGRAIVNQNITHKLYRPDERAVDKSTNNTGLVGKIGEVATVKKFIENGIQVYMPVLDNTKVDLVADFDGKPQRIQVKSSSRYVGVDNGATNFKLVSAGNIFNHGIATPKRTSYSIDEIDYFALYDCNKDEVYLVKNTESTPKDITLRHTPPVTGQTKNINYASDYQIDRYLALLDMGYDPEKVIEPIIFDLDENSD